jgi:hypothetical protein
MSVRSFRHGMDAAGCTLQNRPFADAAMAEMRVTSRCYKSLLQVAPGNAHRFLQDLQITDVIGQ